MGTNETLLRPLRAQVHDIDHDGTDYKSSFDTLQRQRTVRVALAPSATAGTAENFTLMTAEAAIELVSVKYTPDAALTASACNYATLDINTAPAASATLTSIDSISTTVAGTGSWVALIAESFSGIATTDTLTEGMRLVLEITKPGTGVAVPHGVLEITYNVL